jgi:hypothetical protein
LTVGASLARPSDWRGWTKRWNVAQRPIKVFHSVDCANFAGEFRGWDIERRDAFVIRLLDVMSEGDFPGVAIGIQMDEFRRAMAGRDDLRATFGTPYAACFQWVVQTVLNVSTELGSEERIGFVHECNDYKHEALESFGWVKRNANPRRRVIGLLFADKREYVPLQAADMLAYEGNKRMRGPSRAPRRPWQRLNPDDRIIAMHYGRENMGDLIDRLEKIREGRFSEIDLGSGWNRAHFQLDRGATQMTAPPSRSRDQGSRRRCPPQLRAPCR